MKCTRYMAAMAGVAAFGISAVSWAQKAGQSVAIQYGTVTGGQEVDLKSSAVPAGAVVGGALGLMSASGKSSGKKARNTIIGATATGAVASTAQGSQKGMMYQVDTGGGSLVQVVSDQRDIRAGDCVAVEKAGGTANIRRVSPGYCDKAYAAAVNAVANEARKDAEECATAKQQLVDATTPQAVDLAGRKVTLLCND